MLIEIQLLCTVIENHLKCGYFMNFRIWRNPPKTSLCTPSDSNPTHLRRDKGLGGIIQNASVSVCLYWPPKTGPFQSAASIRRSMQWRSRAGWKLDHIGKKRVQGGLACWLVDIQMHALSSTGWCSPCREGHVKTLGVLADVQWKNNSNLEKK